MEHESMAVRLAVILRSEGYAAGALEKQPRYEHMN
jgi:hypothetical protein